MAILLNLVKHWLETETGLAENNADSKLRDGGDLEQGYMVFFSLAIVVLVLMFVAVNDILLGRCGCHGYLLSAPTA